MSELLVGVGLLECYDSRFNVNINDCICSKQNIIITISMWAKIVLDPTVTCGMYATCFGLVLLAHLDMHFPHLPMYHTYVR